MGVREPREVGVRWGLHVAVRAVWLRGDAYRGLAGDTLPGQHSGNGSASVVSVAFIRFI